MHTFDDAVRRALTVGADRTAVVCGDRRLTYRQLGDRLDRVHALLDGIGIGPGDRVAVLALNSIEFLDCYLGISRCGRVQVPLNFRWAEPELDYALRDAGARLLITDRDPGALADAVERVVRIDTGEWDELLTGVEPMPLDVAPGPDDLAGLFYTGGTTGTSKGVMLTHGNLVANAWGMQVAQPMTADDRYLVMAPMFHAAGSISVLQSVAVAATQVILPAFDPATMLDLVQSERITQTLGVPTMVAASVEEQIARPRDVSSLRVYAHGGSPIAMEIVRRGTTAFPGCEFCHLYGATETSPLVTGTIDEVALLGTDREKSCGQPIMGREIVIRSEDGTPLPAGVPGEVTIRGDNVMVGYWNKPDQTARALRDGWYWSGDVGRLDDEGYLFLLDRSKDMIISGGENVYCTEVEDALYTHPAVLEATVFGIPDERWGEAVHAVVVLRDGPVVPADELIGHCRGRIAGYKVPQSIRISTEPLPKSGPGKVLKRTLRAPYWEGHDRDI